MASAGSIFVDLLLRDANFVSGLNKSARNVGNFSSNVQGNLKRTREAFASVLSPVNNLGSAFQQLGITIAAAFSVQRLVSYSDTAKQLAGRLSLVTSSTEELTMTQAKLFKIAQDTRTDFGATVTLYQRLTSATEGLGIAQSDIYKFTEQLNKQLITSGLTSEEATAAIYQLTQAFNKGKLDGDEFRTILESAPPILEALQKSLGKTRGEILQMAKDGKLAPKVLVDAVNSMADVTNKRFKQFGLTISQAFTEAENAIINYVGTSSAANTSSLALANTINFLADNISIVADAVVIASGFFVSKLVASLSLSLIGWIANTRELIRYDLALQAMTVSAGRASFGVTALGAASTVASRALSFFGGPIGAAVFALGTAFYLLSNNTKQADEAAARYSTSMTKMKEINDKLITSHGKSTEELKKQRLELISNTEEQLKNAKARLENLRSTFHVTPGNANLIQYGFTPEMVNKDKIKDTNDQIASLEKELSSLHTEAAKPIATPPAVAPSEKASKSTEKWLIKQRELLQTLRQEADYIGKTSIEVDKLRDARDIETQIAEKSYGLKGKALASFKAQAEAIKATRQEILQYNYELARSTQTGVSEFFAQYVEEASDSASNIKEFLQNTFQSAEDFVAGFTNSADFSFKKLGKSFSSLANGIIQDLLRIQAKKTISGIVSGLGGLVSGSGILGGLSGFLGGSPGPDFIGPTQPFLGGVFDGLFADGGFIEPGHFGIAGEAGAEIIKGGRSGATVIPMKDGASGNTYNIDARGTDPSVVRRLEQSLLVLAGPGVVEQRAANARTRGAL